MDTESNIIYTITDMLSTLTAIHYDTICQDTTNPNTCFDFILELSVLHCHDVPEGGLEGFQGGSLHCGLQGSELSDAIDVKCRVARFKELTIHHLNLLALEDLVDVQQ